MHNSSQGEELERITFNVLAILSGHLGFCRPTPRSFGSDAYFPSTSSPPHLEPHLLLVIHGQSFLRLRRSPESAADDDCKRSYQRASIGRRIGR